jgi:phosphate:Na+ symporter
MTGDIMLALGGVGLFLIGMVMLTEGLRGLAGNALRKVLARFTETPLSGAVTGALTTAAIQSSSATTVTAVGFVGAGLLTFPQALGVIFGANIGTTITGWLVAILGFKLHLGEIVLPLVLVAALLKLFGNQRLNQLGTALAGFSLLFIGIDAMQGGLAAFEGVVTPSDFPEDTLVGRLKLVLIGVLITLITQSSSAGIATALAALGAGAINFPQAAAMVIGMDVGTTFTAALATLGGSAATRRTGFSHVIFNLLVGVVGFLLLGVFVAAVDGSAVSGGAQIAVVAFHTTINVLGVILVLPATHAFARLMTRLVPERGPHLTRHLDRRLLRDPAAAIDGTVATLREITASLFALVANRAGVRQPGELAQLRDISEALTETRGFVEQIKLGSLRESLGPKVATALHILDHLGRLHFRCTRNDRIAAIRHDRRLRRLGRILGVVIGETLAAEDTFAAEERLDRLRQLLLGQRHVFRDRIIAQASTGNIAGEVALHRLDAVRWLHRVCYHLWRIQHHLNRMEGKPLPTDQMAEAELDVDQE